MSGIIRSIDRTNHHNQANERKFHDHHQQPVDNGVNSEALLGARDALTEAPEAAEFTWRSTCTWVHGTHSQSTVTGFSGLGQEHTHKMPFTFDADHPECFASEDRGATPVEIVLAGTRQLPHRRRRRGGPVSRDSAAHRLPRRSRAT